MRALKESLPGPLLKKPFPLLVFFLRLSKSTSSNSTGLCSIVVQFAERTLIRADKCGQQHCWFQQYMIAVHFIHQSCRSFAENLTKGEVRKENQKYQLQYSSQAYCLCVFHSVDVDCVNQSQLKSTAYACSISLKCQHMYFSQSKLPLRISSPFFSSFKKKVALRQSSLD